MIGRCFCKTNAWKAKAAWGWNKPGGDSLTYYGGKMNEATKERIQYGHKAAEDLFLLTQNAVANLDTMDKAELWDTVIEGVRLAKRAMLSLLTASVLEGLPRLQYPCLHNDFHTLPPEEK
jgi:hypothetical protein